MTETVDIRLDRMMPHLNESWPVLPFEECLVPRKVTFTKLQSKDIQPSGRIPVIDQGAQLIAGYTDLSTNKYSGPLPVIIFGDHTRRFKFIDFYFAVGADGTRMLYPIERLDARFFFRYLCSLNITSEGYSRHYKVLKKASVPIPPISEQRRIVAKIEQLLVTAEDCRKRLSRIPVLVKRFRQSVLAAACSGRLTADWREGHLRSAQVYSDGNGGYDLPGSWSWRLFKSVSRGITVGYVGPMAKEYQPNGIPFLRSLNVRPFRFDPENLKFVSPEFHARILKSKLSPGDVAIVRSGNSGVACVIPESLPEANCSDLVILRPNADLNAAYACIFLNSNAGQAHVNSVKVGIAQGHFNVGSMKLTLVPHPPIDEQEEIVRRVNELFSLADTIECHYKGAQHCVDHLSQSILAKAFRGELVPTEAELAEAEGRSFTSAEELLERVRRASRDTAVRHPANSVQLSTEKSGKRRSEPRGKRAQLRRFRSIKDQR